MSLSCFRRCCLWKAFSWKYVWQARLYIFRCFVGLGELLARFIIFLSNLIIACFNKKYLDWSELKRVDKTTFDQTTRYFSNFPSRYLYNVLPVMFMVLKNFPWRFSSPLFKPCHKIPHTLNTPSRDYDCVVTFRCRNISWKLWSLCYAQNRWEFFGESISR